VFGAVHDPGPFEMRQPVRLSKFLATAGGLKDSSDGTVQVVHTGEYCFQAHRPFLMADAAKAGKLNVYPVATLESELEKANPYLQPGDIVIATELPAIYITGNVKGPRAANWQEGLTLTQALVLAGGVLPNTRTNKLRIYRVRAAGVGSDVITVDLKRVRKHRDVDPLLRPYDIIDVLNKHQSDGGCIFFSEPSTPLRIVR
jgi:protein involved in polysaccharide export with SLBB domain